jgi:hypothetical protein
MLSVTDQLPQTEASPLRRRQWSTIALRAIVLAALVVGSAYIWAGPRSQVRVPGPDATPVEVVSAYIAALDQRDFDTANAIDNRDEDLGRFSSRANFSDVTEMSATREGGVVHVTFLADIDGDASIAGDDDWWGYYLKRGRDDRWHIVDAGVA